MQVFMYTVKLPNKFWEKLTVQTLSLVANDVLYWRVRELNNYFHGEFSWKILNKPNIYAIQYINPYLVRIMVKAIDLETATQIAAEYSLTLQPKKHHRYHHRHAA